MKKEQEEKKAPPQGEQGYLTVNEGKIFFWKKDLDFLKDNPSKELRFGDFIEILVLGVWVKCLVCFDGNRQLCLQGLPGLQLFGLTARLIDL